MIQTPEGRTLPAELLRLFPAAPAELLPVGGVNLHSLREPHVTLSAR